MLRLISKDIKETVSESLAGEAFMDLDSVPSSESDIDKFIRETVSKAPVFPRSILTVGLNLPLAQQKSYKRQLVKTFKHIWIISHLKKFFSDEYGKEFSEVLESLYNIILKFPVDPLTTGMSSEEQEQGSVKT